MIAGILGGVGIFLIGMILLTEGLKAAAGGALRGILQRVVRGPASSVAAGTAVTALVQSSSATTLTTIGFVSAGLLTFPQAIGLIFGANLGTTSTGWLVSMLGLKFSISVVALPLVGVGALGRLLARGRLSDLGLALAGFGLIFVGIDTLQTGMAGLAERIDPASFPGPTLGGRTLLVLIGVVMTVIMQSSSAAVATVLTALHAGNLTLEQTAFLVIGQNVGTTVTAALAAIGASVPARRTALAHILFNLGAAAIAVLLMPVLLSVSVRVAGEADPAVAIAMFHTAFNLVGVLVFMPVLGPFSRWVERLMPERESMLTRHLDRSVAALPAVAVETARRAVALAAFHLFREARSGGRGSAAPILPGRATSADPPFQPVLEPAEVRSALLRIRGFLGQVHTPADAAVEHARHLSVLHAVEHLERFSSLLREEPDLFVKASDEPLGWRREREGLLDLLGRWSPPHSPEVVTVEGSPADGPSLAPGFRRASAALADVRKANRDELLRMAAAGEVSPEAAGEAVERLKRADALGYHAWRAVHHLERADFRRFPTARGRGSTGAPEEPMDAPDGSPGVPMDAPGEWPGPPRQVRES